MSSPPTIEPFKGTNWEECNSFIRAIRAAAWKEGKSRDLAWAADFAGLHFSHKALTWHSRLPRDVRDDWEKLPRIEPTPAAAPSLNRKDRADRPLQGVLKLVIDGSDTNFYFKLGTDGCGVVTAEAKEATRFRCSSLSNATLLERTDGSRHSWLAIQWTDSNPNLKKGSVDYAVLVFVDSLTLKTSDSSDTPYQLAACTLSTDDEVIPVWENDDASKITIGIFRDGDGMLCVAPDPDAYSKRWSSEKKLKIFIELID